MTSEIAKDLTENTAVREPTTATETKKTYECPYGPSQYLLGANCGFRGSFKEVRDHVPSAHADLDTFCSHHQGDPHVSLSKSSLQTWKKVNQLIKDVYFERTFDAQFGICPLHDLGFKKVKRGKRHGHKARKPDRYPFCGCEFKDGKRVKRCPKHQGDSK